MMSNNKNNNHNKTKTTSQKNQTKSSSTNKQNAEKKISEDKNQSSISNQTNQNNQTSNTKSSSAKKQSTKKNIIAALIIFGVTFLVAILGTILGGKMVEGRTNPPAYPPEWVFPIAWGILYVLIALATFLNYMNVRKKESCTCSMVWYLVHLFFNLFWPLFYFRLDMLIVSCFILLSMVITAIVLTFKYFKNNLVSGTLFTIYTLWLLYAMYLNLAITLLNVA